MFDQSSVGITEAQFQAHGLDLGYSVLKQISHRSTVHDHRSVPSLPVKADRHSVPSRLHGHRSTTTDQLLDLIFSFLDRPEWRPELKEAITDHNEDIKAVTLRNALENNMLISPAIQKDIVSTVGVETSNAIIMELGDAFFSVLIDESRDISTKEQMAVALQYVDKKGHVVECFLGIKQVTNTSAL
uniref:DUF4371 domain-containing protein n=1 Tax=Fagus sylvatica TaxID=28930 RepID=A0A2N9EL79_FAGSY